METKDTVDKINAAVTSLRAVLENELITLENQFRSSSGDIHKLVQERKHLAKELALDKKLVEIFDEIRYYPSWAQKPDWQKLRMCEIDDPREEKREHEQTISFALYGNRYFMTYVDKGGSSFEDEYFHHTKLSLSDHAGRLLIEVSISVEHDYVTILKPFDIGAFIPGQWIQAILECYEKFEFRKKQKKLLETYDEEKIQNLKNRFGLGE